MRRYALALCVAVALAASGARSEQSDVLVPEGELSSAFADARWVLMRNVTAVAFSPDGELLASGEGNGTIRLWEVSTGHELRQLLGHADAVLSLSFSPTGKVLASGSKDNTARLWEVSTGRAMEPLLRHNDLVRSVAFDPQGETLASGSSDKTVKLWSVRNGELLDSKEGPTDPILTFTPGGHLLASSASKGNVQPWEVNKQHKLVSPKGVAKVPALPSDALLPLRAAGTGRALQPMKEPSDPVLAFSPDGRLLASGGHDNIVRLRDTVSKEVLNTMEGHTAPVLSMAFSPDGHLLATGGGDNTVRLWDIATGKELRIMQGNTFPVWSLGFSPDGSTLVSGGGDALLHSWDLVKGSESNRLEAGTDTVRSLAISADGRLRAWGGEDGTVYLWEPTSGARLLKNNLGTVYSLAFSPESEVLAVASKDRGMSAWRISKDKDPLPSQLRCTSSTQGALGPSTIRAVAFSPKGGAFAWGGDDGLIYLCDFSPGRPSPLLRPPLKGHVGPVRALAFSLDGQFLASGGDDAKVRLWDARTGSLTKTLKEHIGPVWSVAFSPDRHTLASAGGDQKILLWKLNSDHSIRTLNGHTAWITSLAFSPDGLSLASADDSGVILLWAPQEDGLPRGTLRGARQGWMSQLRDQPVLRHDDGSFLSLTGADGTFVPISPLKPTSSPQLSVVADKLQPPLEDFGKQSGLVLTLSNAEDAGRAYWVRVELIDPPPGLTLLPGAPLSRLEPGSSTDLHLGLSYLRPENAPFPKDPKIRLQIVHAFGEGPSIELQEQLHTPELAFMREPYVKDEILTFTLKNTGSQDTGPLLLFSEFEGYGKPASEPQQTLDNLKPDEESRPIPIALSPEVLKSGKFQFKLTAQHKPWPHKWPLPTLEVKVPITYGLYIALALGALLLTGGVHYARVYRNPMVVHAQRAPDALKSYPLTHMVEADQALRRAGRLDSTITAAGIPATRWERMLRGAKEPQVAATAFAEAIGGRVGARLSSNSWVLSLPPLRLRFARDSAVVVIDGTQLESGEAERLMADVFQEGRGPSQVLVLDRTNAQNACKVLAGVPRVRCVTLSANRLRDLLLADEPARTLETTISEQIAVSELSPYQVAGGVKLENLFFGREREIRAIADRAVRNFLVVGQRQMGKSSLLLAVLRRLQSRQDLDAHYVELADGDLHRRLARERELVPSGGAPLPSFEEVAAGAPSRPRVWLVDEADDFISTDAKAGYPVLQAMRALAEEGRAYFILAGFWDLYRAVVLDEKQPLRNFGEHLRLEPLDPRSALALVTEPMTTLNLQWDTPATPEFLLGQAGRRANLLVLVCKALVESLPPDTHVLTREHLERVLREDKDLRDQGRRWRGDHPLHRAVVRQALLLGRPTRDEVWQALKARGTDLRSVDFDEAMDHRELSYVLVPDGDGRLYCPVPLMQRYIESERSIEVGLAEDLEDLRRRGLTEVPKPA